jgi:3-oxoacyl-[acyl-carrier protein] reductase
VTSRAVLITGASRGIGAATARAFADNGDRVVVHYHQNKDRANEVLGSLTGSGHIALAADVTDASQVKSMVDAAATELGGLDVLVNNAGVYIHHDVTTIGYDRWQEVWSATLSVNLIGTANVTWCALQHMMPRQTGRVINVSSWGAFRGEPHQPAYGASKAGVNSLGQSLARALGRSGIQVMSIAPSWVDTEMTADQLASQSERINSEIPLGRVATADEVARAVLYLASADAEFASGAILDFNGAAYTRT